MKVLNVNFKKNYSLSIAEVLSRLPLIFTVGFLAKSIGVEAFGAWSLVLIMQTLFITIGSAGMSSALIRYVPNSKNHIAYQYLFVSFQKSLVAILPLAFIVFFFYEKIGYLLNINIEYHWLLMMSLIMALGSIVDGHLDAYFKGRKLVSKQIYFLLTRTIAEIFSVLLVFYFLDFSHSSNAISIYVISVVSIKFFIYPWLVWESAGILKNKLDKSLEIEFTNFGYLLVPGILIGWAILQADRIIIGQMLNAREIGVYAFSATLASYFVFLSYSIMPLFQSIASSHYDKGDIQKLHNLFEIWQYIFSLGASIALIFVVFFSREILILTAGEEFSQLPHLFIILSLAIFLEQFFGQYHFIFYLKKTPKLTTIFFFTKLITLLSLIPIFIYFFGLNGAAIGVLATTFLVSIVQYKMAIKLISLKLTFFLIRYLIILTSIVLIFYCMTYFSLLSKPLALIILIPLVILYSINGRKKLGYYIQK
ncbi:oligosaccharide flippase family protein [Candidatus Thioglobus sp.]|nr:oligosaccharide flippase family protein [Candidatus Thioglobus sp.]